MNAERLHAIALVLHEELGEGAPRILQQLSDALRQAAKDPAQQQTVSDLRSELVRVLSTAPSNGFSPAWREALDELGIADLLGEPLAEHVESVFTRNEITLGAAADDLSPKAARLNELDAALGKTLEAFDFFGLGAEELAYGEFEIGFLIPRRAVDGELQELGEEFISLRRILGPFLELGVGTRPDVAVRSISSSEFQVFLDSAPAVALLVATTIERLISSYEKVMSIRLARKQLEESGASETTLQSVADDAETKMEKDIAALVEELLTETSVEPGRANELRTELRLALNGLANRIDDGYSIEVRTGPPEATESDGADDEDSAEGEQLSQIVSKVLAKQERLKFANLSGQPILHLPEPTAPTQDDSDA